MKRSASVLAGKLTIDNRRPTTCFQKGFQQARTSHAAVSFPNCPCGPGGDRISAITVGKMLADALARVTLPSPRQPGYARRPHVVGN